MTHRIARVLTVAAIAGLPSCRGGDSSAPATTDQPETASTARPPEPTTSTSPATTELPTTTLAPTTLPPVLGIELVTEFPDRKIEPVTSEGSTILGLAESPAAPIDAQFSFVRLDPLGAVVADVPVTATWTVFDARRAGERWFAFTYDGVTCGVRELDVASLNLLPPIGFPTDRGCGGRLSGDDTALYTTDVASPDVLRFDVATATTSRLVLTGFVPDGYDALEVLPFGGHTYVTLVAGFDFATGENETAPDGSPLPPLLVRIDSATGAITSTPVGAFVDIAGDQLIAELGDGRVQLIDPTTLTIAEVTEADVPTPDDQVSASGDGLAWRFRVEGSVLIVERFDLATDAAVQTATLDTGLATDTSWLGVQVGEDYYVFGSTRVLPGDGTQSLSTRLYRAALRPAS